MASCTKTGEGQGETLAMGCSGRLLFYCSVIVSLAALALADESDPYFECRHVEDKGNYTANSTYQANLNGIVSQLSSLTEFNYGFFNLSAGESPDKVNAIALCSGDRTQDECNSCLNHTATVLLQRCPWYKEVTAWDEFCLVRYANRDIFGQLENEPRTCAYNERNASNPEQFNNGLSELLNNLSSIAAAGGPLRKYAAGNAPAGNLQKVYAAVQCTPDMDEQNCTACLNHGKQEFLKCCYGRIGCRVLRPTCILRYESDPFYNPTLVPLPSPPPSPTPPGPTSPPTPRGGKGNNTTRTVIIVIALVVSFLILIIVSICIFSRRRKPFEKVETADVQITGAESLQFDFASVLDATNNFSDANKLGQGGFGAVYKVKISTSIRTEYQYNLSQLIIKFQLSISLTDCIHNNSLQAWRNWREGTALNLIDPTLSDGSRDDMMRCIHIGLLCVQENVAGRPTMASVVFMLNSFSTTLAVPSQPAFALQSNNIESDRSSSLGTNSWPSESNQSKNELLPVSQNEVSITELSPR
ncbi:hypothetical protein SCA6_020310 [Theobroma cacao]